VGDLNSNTQLIQTLGKIEEATESHGRQLGKLFDKTDEAALTLAKVEVHLETQGTRLTSIEEDIRACPYKHSPDGLMPARQDVSFQPPQLPSAKREIKLPFITIKGFTVAGVVIILIVAGIILFMLQGGTPA